MRPPVSAITRYATRQWGPGTWIGSRRWCSPRLVLGREGSTVYLATVSGKYIKRRLKRTTLPWDACEVPAPDVRRGVRAYRRAA